MFAQSVVGQLPEYPHPDGSALRHKRPDDQSGLSFDALENDETCEKQPSPVVSVYIPSAPG